MNNKSEVVAWMVKVLFNYSLHSRPEPKKLGVYTRKVRVS